jgi:hypothetical protein
MVRGRFVRQAAAQHLRMLTLRSACRAQRAAIGTARLGARLTQRRALLGAAGELFATLFRCRLVALGHILRVVNFTGLAQGL